MACARPGSVPRWLAAGLFSCALAGAFWRLPDTSLSAFLSPPPPSPSVQPVSFSTSLLPATQQAAEVSLTRLADGRIAAAWSASSLNNEDQRSIWFSIQDQSGWQAARLIASRESTAGGTFTHVDALGNPLLHAEGGWLHLWYTSRDGLAGASLNHGTSTNSGQSWTKPAKLQISPLAAGKLQPGSPTLLQDGGLGLPLGGHGDWLRLTATGRIVGKQRLLASGVQTSIIVIDPQQALALLRGEKGSPAHTARTVDGGQHWQAGNALPIASTPFAALRLRSGRLLLAGNPESGRATLRLWLSADGGQTWQASKTIEDAADGAADFSEPALVLGSDGRIHLAYGFRHQGIKYASFNEAWLDGGSP